MLIVVADVLPVELLTLFGSHELLRSVERRVIVLKDRVEELLELANSLSSGSVAQRKSKLENVRWSTNLIKIAPNLPSDDVVALSLRNEVDHAVLVFHGEQRLRLVFVHKRGVAL